MNNKIFYIEYKSSTGKMYHKEERADYILNGDEPIEGVDYTDILEDYVEFLSDGDADLVYWELNDDIEMDEYLNVLMLNEKEGFLVLDSKDLRCNFKIKKADAYYIDEIAEWVIDEYPIYKALGYLEESSEESEIIAMRMLIEKKSRREKYKITSITNLWKF